MRQSGVRICAGIDADHTCRYPFEANVRAKFHRMDVAGITPEFVDSLFPPRSTRILAGCAPCQPFSTYAHNTRRDRSLPMRFADLIGRMLPDIVAMENVPGLARYSVFKRFLGVLERAEYHVWYGVVDCAQYGVPQTRKRLVLLASRLGPIAMPPPTHPDVHVTVRNAIYRLKPVAAGGASRTDPLHVSSALSGMNMRRIRHSVPGGTWRDWPGHLRSLCHTRHTGRTYDSVYGRMEWDRPGPTITTEFNSYGSGRFGHPEQHRAISLREGALLQTFPPEYEFVPPGERVRMSTVARLIGNAVPVRLGTVIGACIIRHVRMYRRHT